VSKRQPDADWSGGSHDEPSLVEQIKTLAEAMVGTQVTELELTEGGLEIHLRRQTAPTMAAVDPATQQAMHPMPTMPAAGPSEPAEMSLAVMAPLTGVFYASSSPASPPFVQVGESVQPGQVICIVEAMKVFNEIKTEIGGIVVAIPPKNGQLVKKGDPLVRIKPH
jgi:acetyl-CoA carboxylase biotin carboxyl carrier protein